MSNLVDKEKLLEAFSDGLSPELLVIKKRILDGELDFHPAPRTFPGIQANRQEEIDVSVLRKTCMGAVMGKACIKARTCPFPAGEDLLPCQELLAALRSKGALIKSGGITIWDPLTRGKYDLKPI